MNARGLRRLMNWWPPFLFAGIHVRRISDDFGSVEVEMRQRWYNRNYVGTHFGGSLFAMTDPFWMIMLLHRLGRDYLVWDQAGAIDFVRPGRGTVSARFELSDAAVAAVRAAAEGGEKHLQWFETEIRDGSGELVARVRKQVYVRRKRDKGAAGG